MSDTREIERRQFTAWDRWHHFQFDTPEYIEHERISTGLSSDVCSYGYVEITNRQSDGSHSYKWIPLAEAKAILGEGL